MKYTIVGRVVNDTFVPCEEQRTVGYVLSNEQGVCRAFTLSQTHELYKKGEITTPINSFSETGIDFKGIDNSLLPKYSERYVSFTTKPYVVDTRQGVMAEVHYKDTRQGCGFIKPSPVYFFNCDPSNVIAYVKRGSMCLANATVNKGVIEQSTTKVIVSYDGKNYTVVEAGGNCVSLSAEAIITSMQKGTIYFNAYLKNDTIVFKHNIPHVATPVKEQITFVNEFKTKDIKGYIEKYTSKFKGNAKAPDIDTMFLRYGTMESRYKGDVLNGKPHGKGVKLFENGDYYEGEWKHGFFEGKGRLVCPATRMVYDGNFKKGVPHGYGNFYYACKIPMLTYDVGRDVLNYLDCLRYEGNFVDGKRHGKGKMYLLPHSFARVDKDYVKDYDEHYQGDITFEGQWENDEMVHGVFRIASLVSLYGKWKNGHIYGNVVCFESLNDGCWSDAYKDEMVHSLGVNFFGLIDSDFKIDEGVMLSEGDDVVLPFTRTVMRCDNALLSLQRITENTYQGDIFYTNGIYWSRESVCKHDEVLGDDISYPYYGINLPMLMQNSYAIYRGNLNSNFEPHGKGLLMFRYGYYKGEFEHGEIMGRGTVYLNNLVCASNIQNESYLWCPYTVTANGEIKFQGLESLAKFNLSTVAKIEGIWYTHFNESKVWGASPVLYDGKITVLSDCSEYKDGVMLMRNSKDNGKEYKQDFVGVNEGIVFFRGKKGMTYDSDTPNYEMLVRCLIEMVNGSLQAYTSRHEDEIYVDVVKSSCFDKWAADAYEIYL